MDFGKYIKISVVPVLLIMTFPLGACDLDIKSRLSESPMELHEDMAQKLLLTQEVDNATLESEAYAHQRYGSDTMRVTVTYNPSSKTETALWASQKVGEFAAKLRRKGVKDLHTDIMPVSDASPSRTILSYTAVTAHPPSDCVPYGPEGEPPEEDYLFGCTIKSNFARQIYRPSDFVTPVSRQTGDGRRQSKVVEGYRSGEPPEPLQEESASGE